MAVDPGDTTGWCLFDEYELVACGQVEGDAENIRELLLNYLPQTLVIEEYRIYAHKLEEHSHSNVPTLRLIGAIEYVCKYMFPELKVVYQSAAYGKDFCTNDRLKGWGLYQRGKQHATDAIRHAIKYILFGVNRG